MATTREDLIEAASRVLELRAQVEIRRKAVECAEEALRVDLDLLRAQELVFDDLAPDASSPPPEDDASPKVRRLYWLLVKQPRAEISWLTTQIFGSDSKELRARIRSQLAAMKKAGRAKNEERGEWVVVRDPAYERDGLPDDTDHPT